MFLNDFYKIEENKKLNKLIKSLKIDHGVDVTVYESLSSNELVLFLEDLHEKKIQIIKILNTQEQFFLKKLFV